MLSGYLLTNANKKYLGIHVANNRNNCFLRSCRHVTARVHIKLRLMHKSLDPTVLEMAYKQKWRQ